MAHRTKKSNAPLRDKVLNSRLDESTMSKIDQLVLRLQEFTDAKVSRGDALIFVFRDIDVTKIKISNI